MLINRYHSAKAVRSCYEAGFSGFGLHRSLEQHGIKNLIVHPGAVEVSSSRKKTDKRDAKQMSHQLYAGTIKGIYIPSKAEEDSRRICRLRRNLVKDRIRMRVRVRMLFNYYGILSSNHEGVLSYLRAQRIYVSHMSEFGEGFKKEIGTYLTNWELHTKQINKLNRDIKCLSESSELDKYYRSVPGIGLLTARVLTVELGDMSRFKNVKQLYSYIGLTPSEFSSGDQRYLGRISKEGKPIIRAMLIQSAWKAIKEDRRLSPIYKELKHRKGGKRAIVAIARRLAGIARSCAKNGSLYKMPEVKEDKKMAA